MGHRVHNSSANFFNMGVSVSGKRISEKTNGVRLLLNAQNAVLEPSGRAGWLGALAMFTDAQTGYSACSLAGLRIVARQDGRSFRRALEAWSGDDLQHLVLDLDARRGGPFDARLFRVHWERLQWLARGLMITRRRIGAGAARALERRNLIGAPATAENCAAVIAALQGALLAEQEFQAAREIEACQSGLVAAFDGWPSRILDHASELTALQFEDRVEMLAPSAVEKDGPQNGFLDANSDILSAYSDILSTDHYKDDSPQGIQKRARDASLWTKSQPSLPGGNSGMAVQGDRAQADLPFFRSISAQYLAARLGGSGKWRAHIGEALLGCRVWQIEQCLVIAATDGEHVGRLHEIIGSKLVDNLQDLGFDGYQITVRRDDVAEDEAQTSEGGHVET